MKKHFFSAFLIFSNSSFKINTPAKILTIVDKLFNKPMAIGGELKNLKNLHYLNLFLLQGIKIPQ